MTHLGLAFRILKIYLSLSKPGKRFLIKASRKSRRVDKTLARSVLSDLFKFHYFIKNLKVCDKVFNRQVSSQLRTLLNREESVMYARFVSYGWFSLLIWGKLLEAFDIPYDQAAQERCVLVAFTHREWNDLFDNQGYSFDQLFKAFDYPAKIPPELTFLRQLKQMEKVLAPPDRFPKFYEHLEGFSVCSLFAYTPEKAEIILDQVAPYVVLLFMYIMVNDLPEGLIATTKPLARWLYMLDELADLEHDQKINRITYMLLAKDPEKTMWEQYETCRKIVLRNAPNPDKLIKFMESLTAKIITAQKNKTDVESSFFNIG